MDTQNDQVEELELGKSEIALEEAKVDQIIDVTEFEQSLSAAVLWGGLAALLGAIIWAVITAITGYQIGWMAVGIGVLVGFAVRKFGKGTDNRFGFVGAGMSLFGCVLGNLFTIVFYISTQYDLSYFEVLGRLDFEIVVGLLTETFSAMDALFYGIAIYEGFKFSVGKVAEE